MNDQHGFRKFHNCVTAVSSVHDFILSKIDKNRKVIGIFLNLSKAFDCLNHKILLKKLYFYGIKNNELKLFDSYLSNRVYFTEM